ncbi:MAG: hypothetical protein ACYTG5_21625, partial [Planctomycetota bacterium]
AVFSGQLTVLFEIFENSLPREMRAGYSVDENQAMFDKLLPLVVEHELEDLVTMTGYEDQVWRLRLVW